MIRQVEPMSPQYWQLLENATHLYVIRTDLLGYYTYVNTYFAERFQFNAQDTLGTHSLGSIILEDHAKAIATVQECLVNPGKAISVTLRKPLHEGIAWTDWEFIAVAGDDGQPVEMLCIGVDSTPRQNATEQLALARKIIDSTETAVVVCLATDDHPVIDANLAFETMTGYSLDEVWGRNLRFLQGDDREQDELLLLRSALKDKRPCAVTLRNYRKNGELFYNELHVTPIYNTSGTLTYYTGLMLDITQRMNVDKQLATLDSERARVHTLEMILEEVAHDLKTPFSILETTIYMMSKLSDRLLQASDAAAEYSKTSTQERKRVEVNDIADNIRRRVESLQHTVEHLRDLTNRLKTSTVEKVETTAEMSQENLNSIVEHIGQSYAPLADERQMTLTLDLSATPLYVRGDREQLTRVVQNLVDNAFKYTANGGTITLKTHLDKGFVALDVQDTGFGIRAEDLPNVFKRRFRTDQAVMSAIEGTGLGLAIVRQIVEDAGGSISVSSTFGVGSTFSVRLPVV